MDYQAMYAAKLTDKETAMNLVRSHDRIMVYGGANVFLTSLCERSGSLESVLRKLTGLLADHCTDLVDRLVGIVDPVLSGVLMLAVGLSLLSVMLPLIGMMNSMG